VRVFVTGLARSDTAADSDGVIHVAHREELLASGGIDAVAAAELPISVPRVSSDDSAIAGSWGSSWTIWRPRLAEQANLVKHADIGKRR
jgi:hypothetical protein